MAQAFRVRIDPVSPGTTANLGPLAAAAPSPDWDIYKPVEFIVADASSKDFTSLAIGYIIRYCKLIELNGSNSVPVANIRDAIDLEF